MKNIKEYKRFKFTNENKFIFSLQNVIKRIKFLNQISIEEVKDMVEMTCMQQLTDRQTQFGNTRKLDLSECIFVFKSSQSDYEEPLSDEEVGQVFFCYF